MASLRRRSLVPGGWGRGMGRGQSSEGRCQVNSLPVAPQATSSPKGKSAGRVIFLVRVSTAARRRHGQRSAGVGGGCGEGVWREEAMREEGQESGEGITSPRARPSSTVGSGTLSGRRQCRPSEPPTAWCRRHLLQARSHGTAAHHTSPRLPPATPCLASPSTFSSPRSTPS